MLLRLANTFLNFNYVCKRGPFDTTLVCGKSKNPSNEIWFEGGLLQFYKGARGVYHKYANFIYFFASIF